MVVGEYFKCNMYSTERFLCILREMFGEEWKTKAPNDGGASTSQIVG